MANPEHLRILKQGVEEWNEWCEENRDVVPDLSGANLSGADLRGADLRGAKLFDADLSRAKLLTADLGGADIKRAKLPGADLSGANLNGADLTETNLIGANLSRANLDEAILEHANLNRANLSQANLQSADLTDADLVGSNLTTANLSKATLVGANIYWANVSEAKLDDAHIGWTVFGANLLGLAEGLESVIHDAPSMIGIDTICRSKGKIPESFLRGAGVPDNFIEYMKSLTGEAIEYYSCFISYSSKNQEFADRLYADLQNKGVRCWFAPEDMKIGDKIRDRLDESIRMRDKLLLILSETSVSSQWVEQEVETALEEERKRGKTVLFPVRLDDTVFSVDKGWPNLLKNSRHVGDFTDWKNRDSYQRAFDRLLRDLKAG